MEAQPPDFGRLIEDTVGQTIPAIAVLILTALGACSEEEPEKQIGPRPAEVAFELSELRHEVVDGRHTYFHSRRYSESIGTGVTLQTGKVCVELGQVINLALDNLQTKPCGHKRDGRNNEYCCDQ